MPRGAPFPSTLPRPAQIPSWVEWHCMHRWQFARPAKVAGRRTKRRGGGRVRREADAPAVARAQGGTTRAVRRTRGSVKGQFGWETRNGQQGTGGERGGSRRGGRAERRGAERPVGKREEGRGRSDAARSARGRERRAKFRASSPARNGAAKRQENGQTRQGWPAARTACGRGMGGDSSEETGLAAGRLAAARTGGG